MKTAPNDFALCANKDCVKKENCKRWFKHYTGPKHPRCFILTERGQRDCELYEEIEE